MFIFALRLRRETVSFTSCYRACCWLAWVSSSQKASFLRSSNGNSGKAGLHVSTENDGGTEAPKAHQMRRTNPSHYTLLSDGNRDDFHISCF